MLVIEGSRLVLRDHIPEDLEEFHEWISDVEVTKFLPNTRTRSKEESFVRLAECIKESLNPDRTKYFLAVILKETNEVIGDAGFTVLSRTHGGGVADMGYFISQKHWGSGYATESARLLIDHCFGTLSLHKVIAGCDAANTGSERVMVKCGMKLEARHKKHVFANGSWRDRLVYAILREDL